MTPRAWFTACLLAAFFGAILGWSIRTFSLDHRYTRALIERNEAVSDYYALMSDRIIEPNKTKTQERKAQK